MKLRLNNTKKIYIKKKLNVFILHLYMNIFLYLLTSSLSDLMQSVSIYIVSCEPITHSLI